MSVLLRAALVIAALSYCAMLRGDPAARPDPRRDLAALVESVLPRGGGQTVETTGAVLAAMPEDKRERLAREAMREAMSAIVRRVDGPEVEVSHDTLGPADRDTPWRGAPAR